MRTTHICSTALAVALVACLAPRDAGAYDVVLNAQGEFLDAYLINGETPAPRKVFIDPDPPNPADPLSRARVGRHVNGPVCFFPPRFGRGATFVIADDTYREACVDANPSQARCAATGGRNYVGQDPDGWGVFRRNGRWTKRVIAVPWTSPGANEAGNTDPQGCLFLPDGRFIGVDVGPGDPGSAGGSIVVFFPGPRKRYDTYCFLKKADLAQPSMPVLLDDGTFLMAETGSGSAGKPPGLIHRYGPPFPASEADCANPEKLVTTPPADATFSMFPASAQGTPAGIARVPGSGHFYISSPLVPSNVNEYDAAGLLVRTIAPSPMNPLGVAAGSDGTAYFAELHLDPVTFSTGCGSMARVRLDGSGNPLAQEILSENLRFPDGVTLVDSADRRIRPPSWERLPVAPVNDPSACEGE